MNQLAQRYAEALFELASEANQIDLWQKQARQVSLAFKDDQMLLRFFTSVEISKEDKKHVLRKTLADKVDPTILNFLCLLLDKNRLVHVSEILDGFYSLCNQSRHIMEGVVYSARPLDQAQIQQLEKALQESEKSPVELENKIDPRLLSGVKVIVNEKVIDASMKNRIESMKNELLKETR